MDVEVLAIFICLCIHIFTVAGSNDQDWTAVPNTPLCYHYIGLDCKNAQQKANVTQDEVDYFCTPQTVTCIPEREGHSACVAVWNQNDNETLPSHTDNSLNNTVYMSCFKGAKMDQETCSSSCVADRRTVKNSVSCCCKLPLCNSLQARILNITSDEDKLENAGNGPHQESEAPGVQHIYIGLLIAAVIGVIGTVMLIIFVLAMRRRQRRPLQYEDQHSLQESDILEELESGLSLQAEIAQGRYAKVYEAGEIHGVKVAIKCFTAAHRKMWQQERDIYKTPGMASNHNIARFYGSTQQGSGNEMTMWIVVQYYPNGSICDYLKGHTLSWPVMLKLAHSMMQGLAYLHDGLILSDGERSSLAHRDIKSKNILIQDDMTAAIADFGLAQYFRDGHVDDSQAQFQAGTHRYMAPEVLDGAISFSKDAFLRIDVYAAALVMWELLTRCEISEYRPLDYRAPYEDLENDNCSLLETLQIAVSKERKRPAFPASLYTNQHAASLITTIQESWDADSEARLSAGCVEARLLTLLSTTVVNDVELNNIRNLEPPPYNQVDLPEHSTPLISYT